MVKRKIKFKKEKWIDWDTSTWYDKVFTSFTTSYMELTFREIAMKNNCEIIKSRIRDIDEESFIKVSCKTKADFFNFYIDILNKVGKGMEDIRISTCIF